MDSTLSIIVNIIAAITVLPATIDRFNIAYNQAKFVFINTLELNPKISINHNGFWHPIHSIPMFLIAFFTYNTLDTRRLMLIESLISNTNENITRINTGYKIRHSNGDTTIINRNLP